MPGGRRFGWLSAVVEAVPALLLALELEVAGGSAVMMLTGGIEAADGRSYFGGMGAAVPCPVTRTLAVSLVA
jgi:hypothetical protein